MIETASGTTYHDALRATFPTTHVSARQGECGRATSPHRYIGPKAVPWRTGYDAAGGAYGYTCGTITDLAAVATDHLKHLTLTNAVTTGQDGQSYASGWRVTREHDGRTPHWHTGTVPGYFSALYLDPHSGDGVAILMNASGYLHEQQLASSNSPASPVPPTTARPAGHRRPYRVLPWQP